MIVALSGGVGGARLAAGLARVLPPEQLLVVVNDGDDFDHWGLRVCPDLDTVMYTLAGRVDESQGWGLADERWTVLEAVAADGGETWFRLGDRDLGTHVVRTEALRAGRTLSEVTVELARRFGVAHRVVPSTDERHRTIVHTDAGALEFQDYFVRRRCAPVLERVSFDSAAPGGGPARPSPAFAAAIAGDGVDAVVICPSNPVLSVQPLLALDGVRAWLASRRFPVVAVSPFIGGRAVKGPAAKIFGELGLEPSVGALAQWYDGLVDAWLVDDADRDALPVLRARGLHARACDTLLSDDERRREVARVLCDWIRELPPPHPHDPGRPR